MENVEELTEEIERLKRALLQSDSEKTTSVQQVTALFDTNKVLLRKQQELEFQVENSRRELQSARKEASKVHSKVIKQKELLAKKRRQIYNLRAAIKAYKQTAECAFDNVRAKYEMEKAIVSETISAMSIQLHSLRLSQAASNIHINVAQQGKSNVRFV